MTMPSRSHGAVPQAEKAALTLMLAAAALAFAMPMAGQVRVPEGRGFVELYAVQQQREGKMYYADGQVELRHEGRRLRADHLQFNSETSEAAARGNVQFDFDVQHLEASDGRCNLRTGRCTFRNVRGRVQIRRAPNASVLLSPNPLYFEAAEVERRDKRTYVIRRAWMTVCEPGKPVWKFYAPRATIHLESSVELVNASFRLVRVPILYLPYATIPAGRKLRQSGFLVPTFGSTSRKGFVLGDAFYWAPAEWFDMTVGAELLSRRGWSHSAELRARPWENVQLDANYYGVTDRGLKGPGGARVPQGGHQSHLGFYALLPGGWRAVADLNQLTSLTFRLAFASTFAEAVISEVRSTAFATNNFRGFSLNFSTLNYKNFLSAGPETAVVLRAAPGVRFSSVEQAPWRRWPVYFGFHASAEAMRRSEPNFETPAAVQRAEFASSVTVPLRWGPWLGVTPTFLARARRVGSSRAPGTAGGVSPEPVHHTSGEINVDIRPPAFARIWTPGGADAATKWKHVVEPRIVYRYVNGVNDFGRFLRFDENDTLTDTNELEYSVTHRFFRRVRRLRDAAPDGAGAAEEIVSWRVAQKYFFDPTFGGAIVAGQRNVFQALNSLTAFAFADGPRRFSPIVSDLRVTPGGRYDAQFRVDYDTTRSKITAVGVGLNLRPYHQTFINIAHFATRAGAVLQPRSHQIRAHVGYGEFNRRGWNGSLGFSYDIRQRFLQNQVVQASYNGSCCGIGFEFRRLALGPVRSENQFRVALLVANIGTFGNLRQQ